MKHLIFDELYRIELGDEDWIDILEAIPGKLGARARSAATKTSMMVSRDTLEGAPFHADFDIGAYQDSILEGMIQAWSFKRDNIDLPITPDNIGHLTDATRRLVLEVINRLNPERTEAEKKGSPKEHSRR